MIVIKKKLSADLFIGKSERAGVKNSSMKFWSEYLAKLAHRTRLSYCLKAACSRTFAVHFLGRPRLPRLSESFDCHVIMKFQPVFFKSTTIKALKEVYQLYQTDKNYQLQASPAA